VAFVPGSFDMSRPIRNDISGRTPVAQVFLSSSPGVTYEWQPEQYFLARASSFFCRCSHDDKRDVRNSIVRRFFKEWRRRGEYTLQQLYWNGKTFEAIFFRG